MPNTIRKRKGAHTISESISVSLGLQNQEDLILSHLNEDGSINPSGSLENYRKTYPSYCNDTNYLGRSYVSGFLSSSPVTRGDIHSGFPTDSSLHSAQIHQSENLHRQTAELSKVFEEESISTGDEFSDKVLLTQSGDDRNVERPTGLNIHYPTEEVQNENITLREEQQPTEEQQIVDVSEPSPYYGSTDTYTRENLTQVSQSLSASTNTDEESLEAPVSFGDKLVALSEDTLHYLPAAILGLLLNILDALSYGMIMFPVTEPVFSSMRPTGLAMFYISTITSQLVYSSGWSSFTNGVGSEMIEVTPFFHTMANAVMHSLDPEQQKDEIITTTIFCYVISTFIMGLTFLMLGKLKLGKIVSFFPRHILIGCIGGVGYFLIITGIEVCTRIAKFHYSPPFLFELFSNPKYVWKLVLPVFLTAALIVTQKHFRNSLVLPSFYITTLFLFHFVVAMIPRLSLDSLRESGWIFPVAASNSQWYDHYKLFDLNKVHWNLVLDQIPTMLALTFFGILHVPINVPALAISIQMDKYDVDKELIAHGWSNIASGICGSIQNYLVYTNSLLFIRAGAESALAGYLLAFVTFTVMAIGPVVISYIPICIVGSLIFLLGYELLVEALWDTFDKLTKFEYITVLIIVLTMGVYDFVLGIVVGILIACFKFLGDGSKLKTINGEFDGTVAKSTVYRDIFQSKFLSGVGEQIYVLKLQNLLFFGTIISIEEKIDDLIDKSSMDQSKKRIKYLILDFKNINADNIDYSAAEGFNRIKRFTEARRIQLIMSSINETDHIYKSFNKVGLLNDVELFSNLNSALEWCENEFLSHFKQLREDVREKLLKNSQGPAKDWPASITLKHDMHGLRVPQGYASERDELIHTPRNIQMFSSAQNVFKNEIVPAYELKKDISKVSEHGDPVLPILLVALKAYRPNIISKDKAKREQEVQFWSKLRPYFKRKELQPHSYLSHDNNIFFLVETGLLKTTYSLPQGQIYETMSNRTCYGKITGRGFDDGRLGITHVVDIKSATHSVLWIIDSDSLKQMRSDDPELYLELVLMIMKIRDVRFNDILGYALVSS